MYVKSICLLLTVLELFTPTNSIKKSPDWLSQYLKERRQFYISLHLDNTTRDLVDDIAATPSSSLTIVNHDTIDNYIFPWGKNPGMKYLHLVILSHPSKFANLFLNIHSCDYLMFLTDPNSFQLLVDDLGNLSNLDRSGGIVVVNQAENIQQLYKVCFYCGDLSGKITHVQNFSHGEPLNVDSALLNNFENFGGHVFEVEYLDSLPYILCTKKTVVDNVTVCEEAVGSELQLLQILSQKLNFSYRLVEPHNTTYYTLIEQLISRRADFAIGGIYVTSVRIKVLTFSNLLGYEPHSLIFAPQKTFLWNLFQYEWKNLILETFLLLVMFLLSVLVVCFEKLSGGGFKLSLVEIFMDFVKSKYEQPADVGTATHTRLRSFVLVIFASWWIFGLIMNVLYRTMLVSMIFDKPMQQLSLPDLVEQGYQIVLSTGAEYNQIFLHSERQLINRPSTVWIPDICEMFRYLQNNKVFTIIQVRYYLIYCSTINQTIEHTENFVTEHVVLNPLAWPFKPGTPFVEKFNAHIRRACSGALLPMWANDVLLKKNIHPTDNRASRGSQDNVMSFEAFVLHFIVYLMLIAISTLCLIFEVLYFRYTRRCRIEREVFLGLEKSGDSCVPS